MFKIICFLIVLYVIIGVLTKYIELTEGLFWIIFLGIVIFVLSIILKFVFSALFIKILLIIAIIAIVVVLCMMGLAPLIFSVLSILISLAMLIFWVSKII